MSRATRLRDEVAPSLFPFLAVLLCTMGALVLILMLIVSGAQASALSIAEESEKQAEEVESQIELASQGFQKQLTEGRLELEKKRLALQHLENHISEIMAELEKLQRTAELAEANAETDEATQIAQAEAISRLEKQLLEQSEKLKRKLDKPDGDKPIFAIIPYDGPNGTHRRPIYLECVEEGVRIQPEGVLIPSADLEPPYGPGNPLDAALRTIRAHYVPANHALTSTAYPLLVVRPTGIRSYAMARAAMSGWDDQFGYELVGEDLELVFPDGEPGLTQKIAQALDLARQRQAALIMAMPQKYREFVGRDGPLIGSSNASGISGRGTGNAGSGSGNYAEGYSGGQPLDGGGWNGDGPSSTNSSRGGWDATAQSPDGIANDRVSLQTNSQLSSSGNNLGFGGGPTALDSNSASIDAGRNFQADLSGGPFDSDHGSNANSAQGDSFFGAAGAADGQLSQNGSTADNHAQGKSSASSPGNSANNFANDASSGGTSHNADNSSSGGSSSVNLANRSGNQLAIPFNAPHQPTSASGGSSSSPSANSSQAASSVAGSPNSFDSPTEPMDGQAIPQVSVNHTLNPQRGDHETTTPIAARKGRGWAWSHGPPSQTSVTRSIRMQCLEDRWVILADSGKVSDPSVTITYDQPPQVRAEKLAKVVSDRVNQWGIALSGGYWKPTLDVDVAPGAEWRFSQLEQLLSGSGLEVRKSK